MNVVSFASSGETCEPQGWFRKPIKTVKDFKGIKFRAGGMAAEVFKALGMTVVILPGGEIVPALQRGVIDAGEFSEPILRYGHGIPGRGQILLSSGNPPTHRDHGRSHQ